MFCNADLNQFFLLLRKGVYPNDYMDSWERFNETLLLDKEAFCSNLNMEDITDVDYRHAKRIFKNLGNKNLGDYYDLYVQSDTILLADVFENFRNMYIKVYELDSAHFLSAPGLAWQACLKKTEVKLELLTDVDMLLMVEKKKLEEEYVMQCIDMQKQMINLKEYNKDEKKSFLEYLNANNLYGWAMSQTLPVDGFDRIKDLSKKMKIS